MHPARFKILQCISEASEPLFVEQIAKAVKEHPRLVSHHLNILQEIGLVDCKYKIANAKGSTRKVAVRLCSPTPKLSQVLHDIAKAVAEVK
jgi:DNA-binding transcriptional ArsR family regulator